ncbi:MAG: regulatory protein RecX [Peptoanaerobacter stomatis]|uniref:regulatory protein RecX n=1 Tax=Peptoanaerobacter stomatis TaxID=796937 RepID=UPI003FA0FC1E
MYEIVKITKKRNSNYNLYIKDYKEEKIEIHLDILYSYSLYSIREVDEETFEEMLLENQKKLAKQQALRILSSSSKTRKELINRLRQKKFTQDAVDYAMNFVDKYEFINEEDMAEKLVSGAYKRKKYSKRKIQNELRQKGIDYEVINELVSDIDDDEEYENAMHFAQKKYKSISTKDNETIKRRLISALSYRGFNYDIIRKVIDKIIYDD